jgi:hypothetical protein
MSNLSGRVFPAGWPLNLGNFTLQRQNVCLQYTKINIKVASISLKSFHKSQEKL